MNTLEQPTIMNYDPNLTSCGYMAEQCVRLTFGLWKARATMDVMVRGNIRGLDVISSAIDNAYEGLLGEREIAQIVMAEGEDTLICEDDDERGVDWLERLLVSAEIVSIRPFTAMKHLAGKASSC